MGKPKREPLGGVLARLRADAHVTLRDVENKADVSNSYVYQLEQGKIADPSPRILRRLAALYSCPYFQLLYSAGYLESDEWDIIRMHTVLGQFKESLQGAKELVRRPPRWRNA